MLASGEGTVGKAVGVRRRLHPRCRRRGRGRGEPADWDVVDLLGALVDKSVVQRVEGVGEYRFRMLDTIREYGAERLEHSGLRQEYARRHQDFFLRMARRAGEEWLGDQQVEWGDRLAADFDNFRVAMDFAVAHPRTAPATDWSMACGDSGWARAA